MSSESPTFQLNKWLSKQQPPQGCGLLGKFSSCSCLNAQGFFSLLILVVKASSCFCSFSLISFYGDDRTGLMNKPSYTSLSPSCLSLPLGRPWLTSLALLASCFSQMEEISLPLCDNCLSYSLQFCPRILPICISIANRRCKEVNTMINYNA